MLKILSAKQARKEAQARGKTNTEFMDEAKKRGIKGRSKMNKGELGRALAKS